MELRQILYFVAIAEAEHFGRASQRLRIAQPALSRQIKMLEAELQVSLFERLPRGVRLTAAGRTFLSRMRGLEQQIAQAAESARAAAQGRHGTLRLGFIEAVAWQGLIPDALRLFRNQHPGVELGLVAMPTAEQLAALRRGDTDAALVYNPQPSSDLTATPLERHPVILAVPAGSALAERGTATLADLRDQPLVGFQRRASPRFYDDVHARFREVGLMPRYVAELSAETEILALVSAGAGMALANSCQMHRPPTGVRFMLLRDLHVSLELCIVHRTDAVTPALERFMDILRAAATDSPAPE
jgi:DNA-binding transcriptional LysR family regulator